MLDKTQRRSSECGADQLGPAARRASAALPVVRGRLDPRRFASCAVWLEALASWGPDPAGRRFARRRMRRLRPQRPRRREQEALAEPHVVIEQVDHRALALDPLGDQIDAEAAEQIGQIGGMDVGRRTPASDRAAARPEP